MRCAQKINTKAQMIGLFGNAENALTLPWFTIPKQIHGVVNAKKDGLLQEILVY